MDKERLDQIMAGKEKYHVLHLVKEALNGCTYYRNLNPLIYLKVAGLADCLATSKIKTSKATKKDTGEEIEALDATLINWADIVVFSRHYHSKYAKIVEAYAECAKDMGKVIIYEADDDLFNIPETNLVYKEAVESAPLIKKIMSLAHGYTVTTSRLGNLLTNYYDKPVFVLPNSLQLDLYKKAVFKKKQKGDKVRIGWAGGITHALDLMQIVPVIEKLQQAFPNVEFVGLGSSGLQEVFGPISVEWHGFTKSVEEYPGKLIDLNLDIGLIPLEDYEFNHNKSAIKWEEYSAAKMATVYADIPPYSDAITDGVTGLGVKNPDDKNEWFTTIAKLIDDVELRVTIAENAHKAVVKDYDMSKNFIKWDTAYKYFLREVCK